MILYTPTFQSKPVIEVMPENEDSLSVGPTCFSFFIANRKTNVYIVLVFRFFKWANVHGRMHSCSVVLRRMAFSVIGKQNTRRD